jgi:ABC-2 type transport system ATP-binding protein
VPLRTPAGMTIAPHLPVARDSLIEAEQLSRQFGSTAAVCEFSLTVGPGELVVLLGPNGAGKTTTLQMLAGLLPPSSGRATVAGYDVAVESPQVRARVGLMIDEPGFYPEMTINAYLLFMARLYGVEPRLARQRIDEMLMRFDLTAKRGARLSSLSKGMRQKVALSRALIHMPPVLLLDEPTSALDPLSAQAVHQYIVERRAAGDAIILSTHQLAEAEALADRVAIIAAGRMQRHGTWAELRQPVARQESFVVTLAEAEPSDVLDLVRSVPGVIDARVVDGSPGRLRIAYRTAAPGRTNPALLATLIGSGAAVVTLEAQTRSMRTVYLEALSEAHGIAG